MKVAKYILALTRFTHTLRYIKRRIQVEESEGYVKEGRIHSQHKEVGDEGVKVFMFYYTRGIHSHIKKNTTRGNEGSIKGEIIHSGHKEVEDERVEVFMFHPRRIKHSGYQLTH